MRDSARIFIPGDLWNLLSHARYTDMERRIFHAYITKKLFIKLGEIFMDFSDIQFLFRGKLKFILIFDFLFWLLFLFSYEKKCIAPIDIFQHKKDFVY